MSSNNNRVTEANMSIHPSVTGWEDFTEFCEFFKYDKQGNTHFSITTFLVIEENGAAFYGCLPISKARVTLAQARSCLERVPTEDIYPPMAQHLPVAFLANLDMDKDVYIKRPNFMSYHDVAGSGVVAQQFMEEACLYSALADNPHPNITKFYGCVVEENRIVGLALGRYPSGLAERVDASEGRPIARLATFEAIVSAAKHLHSLGLAHNDLEPRNIMLDALDQPVIVEFGTCQPVGELLSELGTMDWNDGFDDVSSLKNDEIGLRKIQKWLGL